MTPNGVLLFYFFIAFPQAQISLPSHEKYDWQAVRTGRIVFMRFSMLVVSSHKNS
jgi:hypothetical protein